MNKQLLGAANQVLGYGPYEIVTNLLLALALGVLLSAVYRHTHKGLAYSQSFTLTLVLLTVIVGIVIMAIGSNLARAFALVGAMSIIRFRTVVKDTKDTAFVFAALAIGLASGTSNYFLATFGTLFLIGVAVVLHRTNYGALYKSEFILRFVFEQSFGSDAYLEKIQEFAKRSNLLHLEPSGDGRLTKLTYDIVLKEGAGADRFSSAIAALEGVSEVVLIAAKNDVDY